jgi:hypothetical protein
MEYNSAWCHWRNKPLSAVSLLILGYRTVNYEKVLREGLPECDEYAG